MAQEEARELRHNYIGTEHLLLALLRYQEGLAGRALESLGVTIDDVRAQVVRIVGPGEEVTEQQIPFTPRAKKVLELALREAIALGHNYIGTEHILLGLVRENEGVAIRILNDSGLDSERIRSEVIRMVSGEVGPPREAVSGLGESIRVAPGPGVRRLMMVAAARALDEARTQIAPRDVLLALTRDERMGPVLSDLGVDEDTVRKALERLRPPQEPPQASAG
jgi:ATP-dependent Clp protease ATP-binding subunit ClpC